MSHWNELVSVSTAGTIMERSLRGGDMREMDALMGEQTTASEKK